MTNPFGEVHYDRDGLPINNPKQQPNPYADPFSQPTAGFADPSASAIPDMPLPQQPQAFMNTPVPYGAGGYGVVGAPQKQWIVAVLLAFFFGTFGLHNFYLGNTQRGMVQLGLFLGGSITSFILIGFIPLFIVSIWAFVEFIMVLLGISPFDRDSNNVPLRR